MAELSGFLTRLIDTVAHNHAVKAAAQALCGPRRPPDTRDVEARITWALSRLIDATQSQGDLPSSVITSPDASALAVARELLDLAGPSLAEVRAAEVRRPKEGCVVAAGCVQKCRTGEGRRMPLEFRVVELCRAGEGRSCEDGARRERCADETCLLVERCCVETAVSPWKLAPSNLESQPGGPSGSVLIRRGVAGA